MSPYKLDEQMHMALDAETGEVCTANRVGEAVVYSAGGSELMRLRLGEPIRYAALRKKGTVLTVLTADQHVRAFAVHSEEGVPAVESAAAGW